MGQKVKTFLWFQSDAEEAARFYASLFKDGQVQAVHDFPFNEPEVGVVRTIEFGFGGAEYVAMQSDGRPAPNESFSLSVSCEDQAEVDRLWDALVEGGEPLQCGWLRDRFGFCWQIVPQKFNELFEKGTKNQKAAILSAMLKMVKWNLAEVEEAFAKATP